MKIECPNCNKIFNEHKSNLLLHNWITSCYHCKTELLINIGELIQTLMWNLEEIVQTSITMPK